MNPSMSKHLVLVVVCFAFAFIAASAKETSIAAASPETRQHVQALDPAAATQAWLASVPRSEREKSDAYFEGGYWLILWNFLMAATISIFLLASRISAWLRDFAERVCTGSRWLSLVRGRHPLQNDGNPNETHCRSCGRARPPGASTNGPALSLKLAW